jgi:hypothetical protein
MTRRTTIPCIVMSSLIAILNGCSNTTQSSKADDERAAAMAMLGSGNLHQAQSSPVHRLGAGDSLGQSMYQIYLAHINEGQIQGRQHGTGRLHRR